MFFETIFNLHGLSGEQLVCCPFDHTKADGTTYKDHTPSMAINLDKRVYNCKSCGAGGNEVQMIQQLFNTTSVKAKNFLTQLNIGADANNIYSMYEGVNTDEALEYAKGFGITPDVLESCMVTIEKNGSNWDWDIPVMWYDRCIDIRHYRPGRNPKMTGEPGAPTGSIIPHDLWIAENPKRWTVLCAGEKDMLVTRSHGFNAITFTGGEMMRTPLNASEFKDKCIAICYDNDQPGRTGAATIAEVLCAAGAKMVKVVTGFHQDFGTADSKEDLTDWFTNYGGTTERLQQYIKDAPVYVPAEKKADLVPMVKLVQLNDPSNCGKKFRAEVQVLSTSDETLDVPRVAELKKIQDTGKSGMGLGESIFYDILEDEDHMTHIFEVIGKNVTSVQTAFKRFTGIRDNGVYCYIRQRMEVHVCTVADIDCAFDQMQEYAVYCVGFKPIQGMRYELEFMRTTDTSNGTACLICLDKAQPIDFIHDYELTTQMEASLTYAKHVMGSISDKIDFRAKAVRGLLGYEADLNMIKAIDMTFNSVKEFNYGTATGIKGYLDTIIVGESRVGKSDTAKHLRDAYNVGGFVSLAGSAATIAGIVGGSAKDALGRMSTRAGIIPRNNEAIVIFEELAKSDPSVLKSLTDVRSSGLARITRVSGSVEMPAGLRMLTLSNVRPVGDGQTRPLKSYSGGVEVLTDLIGTAEDIARYDLCVLVGDPEEINPLYNAPEPYPTEILQDLIRWSWSRKAEDIVWADGSDKLIYDLSTELNKEYPLHIKIFGSEAWKKIARLSIAAACYTVSTDDNFEKVLVTPEHVEWAVDYMIRNYDSELFKLKETVKKYIATTQPNKADTEKLQDYYFKYSEAIDMLMENGKMEKQLFKDICNVDDATGNPILRCLVTRHFVDNDRSCIYPTPKFKATYPLLQRGDVPRC